VASAETSARREPSRLRAAMSSCYDAARRIKNSSPILRRLYENVRDSALAAMWKKRRRYKNQLAEETRIYRDVDNVNDLPPIFHYWSDTYVRPMLEEYGCSNPDQFFAKYLHESARQCGADSPVFLSIGAGNCDTEVRIAKLLKDAGRVGMWAVVAGFLMTGLLPFIVVMPSTRPELCCSRTIEVILCLRKICTPFLRALSSMRRTRPEPLRPRRGA